MPAVSIRELITRNPARVLILDGGTGSSLEDRGVDVRSALWSSRALLSPEGCETTRRLHADFFDAGADIVIANTHNVCPQSCQAFLAEHGSELSPAIDRDVEGFLRWIERRGLEVLHGAVPVRRDVVVAAGIGSEEPWARTTARTKGEIRAALEPSVRALLAVDAPTFPIFETVSTHPEVEAIADLARADLGPVGVGVSCGPDGRMWGGLTMTEVLQAFRGADVAAFFVQCTHYDVAARALGSLSAAIEAAGIDAVPGVYANDGRVWRDHQWHGTRVTPAAYADAALEWRRLGARVIGGCCGTTVAHIAALHERLRP